MQGRRHVVSLILVLIGALQAMLFAYYFSQSIHPIPRWDFFDWITGYLEQHAFWQWLWALHNEHRIVISKLVVALDIELFAGQLYPIALLTAVTLVTWLSVLNLAIVRNIEPTANARLAITGIVFLPALAGGYRVRRHQRGPPFDDRRVCWACPEPVISFM